MIRVIYCYLFFAFFVTTTLRFDVQKNSAAYFQFKKLDKTSINEMGEDAIQVSPWALSNSDGVSSYLFHTHFIAQALANGFQLSVLGDFLLDKITDQFNDVIANKMAYHSESLRDFTINFANQANRSLGNNLIFSEQELAQGATFTGSFLTVNELSVPVLKVAQKGDSLVRVFSKTTNPTNGKMSYSMTFGTTEQQEFFNCPYQFNTMDSIENNANKFANFDVLIKEHDIVVMGSDGYFDNVSDGLTLFLINYLNFFTDTTKEEITSIVECYLQVLTDKRAVIFQVIKKELKPKNIGEWEAALTNKISLHNVNKSNLKPDNDFQLRLNKIFEIKAARSLTEKNRIHILREFLSCPLLEILSINPNDLKDIYFVGPCLKKIIDSKLSLTKTEMENSINHYSAATRSDFLGTAANISSKNKNFPSRFRIHSWADKPNANHFGGKKDDITLIAAMVKKGEENTTAELSQYFEQFKNEQKALAIEYHDTLLYYAYTKKNKLLTLKNRLNFRILPSYSVNFQNGEIAENNQWREHDMQDDQNELNILVHDTHSEVSNLKSPGQLLEISPNILNVNTPSNENKLKELEKLLLI